MKQKVMEKVKEKLLSKKDEILEKIEREEVPDEIADVESENVIGDIVDEANTAYELQIYSSLTEKERNKLQEIDEALKRIEEGIYGKCVVCGKEIDEKRLLALPETKMCITCKSAEEKKKF